MSGLPTGPGAAVDSRRFLIWLGVSAGNRWAMSAAAPDVTPVANEVPEPLK